MNPLTLTLKERPKHSVDVSPITPDNLQGKALTDIKATRLSSGNASLSIGQLFNVSGNNTEHIRILQGGADLDYIGYAMSHGCIDVKGGAGDYLGKDMHGGSIRVEGDTGRWAATAMQGGRIEINGNTGDFVCGALPSTPMGMQDGMVVVSGNAGDRAGDRMRRGMLVIEGDAGDYCGSRMLAGTVIILGTAGKAVGFAMKRGSIVLANRPKGVTDTFNYCGPLKMEFLRVLFRHLGNLGERFETFKSFGPEVERYVGDLAHGGKGEILILDNALLEKHLDEPEDASHMMDYRLATVAKWLRN